MLWIVQGIMLIDKPKGWTSFDVVNYVRKIVATAESKKPKNVKCGHTGTLDPLATGLLVLLVGKEYTRQATALSKLDKTYEVTMKLGETSTTGDSEGVITPVSVATGVDSGKKAVLATAPSPEAVLEALGHFTGPIMQTPPVYSAMKVNGQRAYKLAREGKEVVLEPRPVTINSLRLKKYDYPFIELTADVGSGTYIRSLVEDLGKALGGGAYMSDLRRTRVGQFRLADAISVDNIDATILNDAARPL